MGRLYGTHDRGDFPGHGRRRRQPARVGSRLGWWNVVVAGTGDAVLNRHDRSPCLCLFATRIPAA